MLWRKKSGPDYEWISLHHGTTLPMVRPGMTRSWPNFTIHLKYWKHFAGRVSNKRNCSGITTILPCQCWSRSWEVFSGKKPLSWNTNSQAGADYSYVLHSWCRLRGSNSRERDGGCGTNNQPAVGDERRGTRRRDLFMGRRSFPALPKPYRSRKSKDFGLSEEASSGS